MAGDMSVQNLWNQLGVQPGNNGYNYNYQYSQTPQVDPDQQAYNDKLSNWQSAFDTLNKAAPAVDGEALANKGAQGLAASQVAATNQLNEQAAASGFSNSGAKMSGLANLNQKYSGLKADNELNAGLAGGQAQYAHAQDLANMYLKKPVMGDAYGAKGGGAGGSGGGTYSNGVKQNTVDSSLLPRIIGGGTGLWSDTGGAGVSKISQAMKDAQGLKKAQAPSGGGMFSKMGLQF